MPGQIVVLGMHRSGTSGVTRLLNLAGAYFGPEGMATEPNEENPRGFWERRDVRAVCDGLLQESGFDWWKLVGFDPDQVPEPVRRQWLGAFDDVLEDLDAHRPWVLKEPRLCVLFPLVAPKLQAPVIVHVTREPLEVARSMHHRDGFPLAPALALWELYSVRAFEASHGLPRVLVRHEDLMADPVASTRRLVDQLAALGVVGLRHLGDEEVLGFISPELHRQRNERAERREELNGAQVELAEAIDDGSILHGAAPSTVSSGAMKALIQLEVDRALPTALRQLEKDAADAQRAHGRVLDRLAHERADAERAWERQVAAAEARAEEQSRYREVELARRRDLGRKAEDALAALHTQLTRFDASTVGRIAAKLVTLRQVATPGLSRTASRPLSVPLADLERRRADIAAYARQAPAPGGTSEGLFGTSDPLITRTRPVTRRSQPERPSVAVISWDVGHNPLGRANVLAEVLARHFDVEMWGAQFERYGSEVWAPLRQAPVPINVFGGGPIPGHLRTMERVAGQIEADAIWVSKPRLPSYLLGINAKIGRNRPLVLDVDDHELAFFAVDDGLPLDEVFGLSRAELELPFERAWTRACDPFIDAADQITVSNVALQSRYGGLLVPHARDERRFDPARYDREAVRHSLGVGAADRLLLFGGTPRAHKGVVELLEALDRLGDDRYRVLMFGTREFDEMRGRIGDLARWALVLPAQSFEDLPELVNAADLACVIQDPSHPVSRYQLPAKVFDALAMGVPCLVSPTPPLAPLVEAGVLQVLTPGELLHERIAAVFDDPGEARDRAARGRELFLAEYSYGAVGERLVPIFEQLIGDPPLVSPRLAELAAAPEAAWRAAASSNRSNTGPTDSPVGPSVRRPRRTDPAALPVEPGATFDVVMFWKQNDSGIYGRRQDMMVEELSRSSRVGTIVHFDDPISPEVLVASYRAGRGERSDQRRLVVRQTVARVLHRRDEPGVHRHTFLFGGRRSRRLGLPARSSYADYVVATLAAHGLGARPVVVWAYPSNDDLPALIDAIAPGVVVADVVDDNRSWYEPGTSHHERIERNYASVLDRCDVVVANCEPVADAMARFAPEVHVVPNGLELPAEPSGANPSGTRPMALPKMLRGTTGPLIAYVGNLSARLDLPLIEAVARARPQWTIALVGSAHLDRSALELGRLPNVFFLGVMAYEDMRQFLAHVDVGLIPHIDNEMTRSMNPLKAFVYASAGVPVVSTPVANLPDFGDLISIASDVDGFVAAIEAHLAAGRSQVDIEVLRPHSWSQRVEHVFELIDGAVAAPGPT